ncbi:MAG: hypothetical protein METHP_01473 [Methanoregula sp. SKADARSKE-2]|nr:MAG: hypothetical protein METHP_01473 [Methanoregula sp. SKADARSKE-2]
MFSSAGPLLFGFDIKEYLGFGRHSVRFRCLISSRFFQFAEINSVIQRRFRDPGVKIEMF